LMVLSRTKRLRLREGDIFLLYLILYSVGRGILESVKIGEVWTIGGFRTAQLIAFALIVSCSIILAYRHWRRPDTASVASEG
jgi:phosphatidylglycerol---prolipoprotein diacylglyceryl transferase